MVSIDGRADRIGRRGGRTTKILISALLIVLGDRVDVRPDIASRVRHGGYRKAVSGAHPAIVENPDARFCIVVMALIALTVDRVHFR